MSILKDHIVVVNKKETDHFIISDTREKTILFPRGPRQKLDAGDYTIGHRDEDGGVVSMESLLIIERKATPDEWVTNITRERDRLERQFERMKKSTFKFLLMEFSAFDLIYQGGARTNNRFVECTLIDLTLRHGIIPLFAQNAEIAKVLIKTICERTVKHFI